MSFVSHPFDSLDRWLDVIINVSGGNISPDLLSARQDIIVDIPFAN